MKETPPGVAAASLTEVRLSALKGAWVSFPQRIALSFVRLGGGLPNDLADPANDMTIPADRTVRIDPGHLEAHR